MNRIEAHLRQLKTQCTRDEWFSLGKVFEGTLASLANEAYGAGFNAGMDHMDPPMGPGRAAPKNAAEGFERWLHD